MVYCLFLLDGSDDGLGWHYYRYCVLNAYITVFNKPKSQYGESGLCFEYRKYSCQIDSHWTTHTFKFIKKPDLTARTWGKGPTTEVESSQGRIYPT